MAEYWLREATRWRSLKNGTTVPIDGEEPESQMYIGTCDDVGTGEAQWVALEAQTGRMGIRRSYSSSFPATPSSELTTDYGKRASWHSVKGDWVTAANGGYDATMTSFLNAVPANHELMLTFAHEPENDNPLAQENARSAEWRAAQEHLYDVVKSVRPQTLFGPILMGYTFSASSGRNVANWTISGSKCDFYGVDEYNPYRFPMVGNGTTWRPQPSTQLTAFTNLCNSLGVPGAVGETASAEHDSGVRSWKIGWFHDMLNYCDANNYLAYCWFNANKPNDTSPAMMLTSSSEFMAAWAAQVATHQRGVK